MGWAGVREDSGNKSRHVSVGLGVRAPGRPIRAGCARADALDHPVHPQHVMMCASFHTAATPAPPLLLLLLTCSYFRSLRTHPPTPTLRARCWLPT